MKGRKNGCPVNIKNWLIYILDVATKEFVRIYGLISMSRSVDSNTEDGSSDTDTWEEPYVTKRKGSISLEGKPVIVEDTGASDQGQEMLNTYADASGCEADATLKFVDPYGHAFVGDYVVTSREESSDDSGTTLSWDLEQVGETETLPYVHVTGVALADGDTEITELALNVGDPAKLISVKFTPDEASNKRYKVSNNRRSVVTVSNITEDGFSITPVAAGTANVAVTSVSGTKTAAIAVTVT